MRFEDVKLGMVLVANEESNRVYKWTSKNMGAIVKVTEILPETKEFEVVVVGSSVNGIVGLSAVVEAEYFEEAPAKVTAEYKTTNPERIDKPSREAISSFVDTLSPEQKLAMLFGMMD
ncbi:hypothetical protein SCB17_003058 [Clostridium perfringens]|nr:hypothetical protein [Clostridium perfringens]